VLFNCTVPRKSLGGKADLGSLDFFEKVQLEQSVSSKMTAALTIAQGI